MHDFAQLFEAEGPRLFRAIAAFAGNDEIARDAVAEAFAQCIQGAGEIRSPAAWLWKAAFRIASGELHERQRSLPLDVDTVAELGYESPDRDPQILELIAVLPPKQKAAIILRYYVDYDMKRIAEILGCSSATARVHLHRGRAKLARVMESSDD